jgi:hypothetical protein
MYLLCSSVRTNDDGNCIIFNQVQTTITKTPISELADKLTATEMEADISEPAAIPSTTKLEAAVSFSAPKPRV